MVCNRADNVIQEFIVELEKFAGAARLRARDQKLKESKNS
jgi:hypothetical protein